MAATLISGLAGLRAEKKRREAEAESRDRPKVDYFNWKKNKNKDDKNTVLVRFLQEFDKDIEGYNEERGLPVMAVEHQAPGLQGYLRRASCTSDTEGECYPCERHPEDRKKGWGPKSNFYTWALVDYSDGEGVKPVVLSRGFSSSFVDDLLMEVEEDDENRITNKMWKVTKTGTGTSTAWKLRVAKGVDLYDDTDVQVPDLKDSVLRSIPYAEQAAYYGAVYKEGDPIEGQEEKADEAPKAEKKPGGELEW